MWHDQSIFFFNLELRKMITWISQRNIIKDEKIIRFPFRNYVMLTTKIGQIKKSTLDSWSVFFEYTKATIV